MDVNNDCRITQKENASIAKRAAAENAALVEQTLIHAFRAHEPWLLGGKARLGYLHTGTYREWSQVPIPDVQQHNFSQVSDSIRGSL